MRLIYDPVGDTLSIRLRSAAIADSEELEDGLEVLLDADGHVIGFNYADARKRLSLEELTSVTYENLSTKRRESLKLP
jgi:uncharacterized protein YuzE